MRTCRPLLWCVPLIAGLASSLKAQLPDIGDPPAAPSLRQSLRKQAAASAAPASAGWYDNSTRTAVRDSWNLTFWPTITVPTGWTGSVASNIPGTTTQAFKDAVAARINWFRAMAGVPPQIAISPVYSAKDQQAALMFSANRQISHSPPANWVDYTAEGAEAAANSNICYGFSNDPGCAAAYVIDSGSNNAAVGHRRWILYPQTLTMGTGDVPQSGPAGNPYPPANALWVFDGLYGTARPATRAAYVAWPPTGFVPYQVVGPRWSFSYPGADFTSASVSMQRNGAAVPVRQEQVVTGYGENTIVWVPDNLDASAYSQPTAPSADTTSTVTLTNVLINGTPQTFSYSVTVFDPDTAPGSSFQFQPSSVSIGGGTNSGASSLFVTPANTTWTAASTAAWLTLTSSVIGTGSTSMSWSATANSSSYGRTGTIRAGTATFTVVQDGAPCSYAFSAYSGTLPASGGSGSFTITSTPGDCPFGSYSWNGAIAVTSSWAGTGVLTVTYSAGVNNTSSARSSTIHIAGSDFSVTQLSSQQALRFVPLTPCRIADTRTANGPFGGPNLAAGVSRDFNPAASSCGIPANALAYSLNLTVIPLTPLGYISIWPAGQPQPVVSTLNSFDGRIKANAAIVPAGPNGAFTLYATDPTHVAIDINGYFVPASGSQNLAFYPVTPCRVADTRNPTGTFGAPALAGGVSRTFPVPSSSCGIPASAQAYAFNMTVVPTGLLGYLSNWPAGSPQPVVSTLNALTGAITSNASIVPAGVNGAISVYASDTTNLIIDINGYFAPPGTGSLDFYTATPCRVLDTRIAAGALGGPIMGAGQSRSFVVPSSSCGIPAAAKAYSLNATVVPPAPLSYLTLWGSGGQPLCVNPQLPRRNRRGERSSGACRDQRRSHGIHHEPESPASRYQRVFPLTALDSRHPTA